MEYQNIDNLIYFIIIVFVITVFIQHIKKRNSILDILNLENFKTKNRLNIILMILGLSLITFSLTGPKIVIGEKKVEKKGLDIYFLIDVSKSMLTEDIKPNRLDRVKESISSIIHNLNGDRVGFIPFAGSAYIQLPLTDDYDLAKMFLEVVDTNMMSGGGTNIKAAVNLASKSFKTSSSSDNVIILFSDGETKDNDFSEESELLKDIKLYSIGVGTKDGGLIPILDRKGNNIGWKKDNDGNAVVSKLSLKSLTKLANEANGKLYMSTISGNEIQKITDSILKLKRDNIGNQNIKIYHQLFQYFLGLGIVIFIFGYLKNR